ncbi:MOSC domain-containing protein [Aurantimonas sp. Leaf443]|uniref:MOSC domain-containing protein n=1 Tax=Aurantimonas sp. Leaf443 TaxID=1736378 RepID=UPI0006FB682E|nr:MOSC domain-containing protein [Aurantimonas sp. Leaf443]KQT85522.1 hypothetical protein ASG48_09925 [Aurantimonas sp. Leaf443]
MQLTALHIHPLKGARAIPMAEAALEPAGLAGDRRWLLVDAAGRFVSQREMPSLARLSAHEDADGLHLSYDGEGDAEGGDGGERFVPHPEGEARLAVRIWTDTVEAALAGEADHDALSRWFGRPLRLVHFDGAARRSVSRDWIDRDTPVGFADGFPLLVASEASLRGLNREIVAHGGEAVPMSRFRPNLVVSGLEPFEEDGWATIAVGDAVIDLVKPCARCIVTTIDQISGEPEGPEPIDSLSRIRLSADRRARGVLFGWNAVPRAAGTLRVGDPVTVLSRREGGWPLRRPDAGARPAVTGAA